jgi:hypothetical protein
MSWQQTNWSDNHPVFNKVIIDMFICEVIMYSTQEFQSFTDLQFSKERTITCIDWHPTAKGVIAVSVGERLTFDDRIDNASRIIMTPSLILVWSFTDPIHPQVINILLFYINLYFTKFVAHNKIA